MTQQDKATGAVSIDTPEFLRLLEFHRLSSNFTMQSNFHGQIIAHIDAHAAQRYEVGFQAGRLSAHAAHSEMTQKSMVRADAAEASLARLVEGVEGATRYRARSGPVAMLIPDRKGEAVLYADLLALLPAKAEADACNHDDTVRQGAIWTNCKQCGKRWADDEGGVPKLATPAPAMGEELLPLTDDETAYATSGYRHFMSLDTFKMFRAECANRAKSMPEIATMALRQPVARVDRDAVLESAVQAVAERAGDADKLLVLSAFDAIRSLKTNRTALPERHTTAPVSQPAAQEPVDECCPDCGMMDWRDFYTGPTKTHDVCASCDHRRPVQAELSDADVLAEWEITRDKGGYSSMMFVTDGGIVAFARAILAAAKKGGA